MTSKDVINFYTELQNLGIQIWIDGGWGVDALLGKQTRIHRDLDIVIRQKDVSRARELLETEGYKDIPRDDTKPWNFVLGDDKGHEIDFHVIILDDKGNGLYGPAEKGVMYPAASLTGAGTIDGQVVRCISPEYVIKFHSGYELTWKDFKDVSAICEKFGIKPPGEYSSFEGRKDTGNFEFVKYFTYPIIALMIGNAVYEIIKPGSLPHDQGKDTQIMIVSDSNHSSTLSIVGSYPATELRSMSQINRNGNSYSHYEIPINKDSNLNI